jgi:hypothetical protein
MRQIFSAKFAATVPSCKNRLHGSWLEGVYAHASTSRVHKLTLNVVISERSNKWKHLNRESISAKSESRPFFLSTEGMCFDMD